MRLHGGDVWGHFAPLFHLVDVFAVYAITLVGGRHVLLPTFSAAEALLTMGEVFAVGISCCLAVECALQRWRPSTECFIWQADAGRG
jgi:hypothetical protein